MNAKKCANGHFFDADKYPVCPHCGAGLEIPVPQAEQKPPEKAHRRLFKKRRPETPQDYVPAYPFDPAEQPAPFAAHSSPGYDPYDGDKTVSVMKAGGDPMISCPFCRKQNRATAKFCIYCGSGLYVPAPSVPEQAGPPADRSQEWLDAYVASEPEPAEPEEPPVEPEEPEIPAAPAPEVPKEDAAAQSLRDAVLESVDTEDDKTIGFYTA